MMKNLQIFFFLCYVFGGHAQIPTALQWFPDSARREVRVHNFLDQPDFTSVSGYWRGADSTKLFGHATMQAPVGVLHVAGYIGYRTQVTKSFNIRTSLGIRKNITSKYWPIDHVFVLRYSHAKYTLLLQQRTPIVAPPSSDPLLFFEGNSILFSWTRARVHPMLRMLFRSNVLVTQVGMHVPIHSSWQLSTLVSSQGAWSISLSYSISSANSFIQRHEIETYNSFTSVGYAW